jgi:hypothetical protein
MPAGATLLWRGRTRRASGRQRRDESCAMPGPLWSVRRAIAPPEPTILKQTSPPGTAGRVGHRRGSGGRRGVAVAGPSSGLRRCLVLVGVGELLFPAPRRDFAGASIRAAARLLRPPLSSRTARFPRSGWKPRHFLVEPSRVPSRFKRWRAYAAMVTRFAPRLARSLYSRFSGRRVPAARS